MYGLTSRESLRRRQDRWTREIEESVSNNPSHKGMFGDNNYKSSEESSLPEENSSRKSKRGFISIIPEPDLPINKSNKTNKKNKSIPFNNHLMGIIPDNHPDELTVMQKLYEEMKSKYIKLEHEYESLRSDLISRTQNLEQEIASLKENSASQIHKLELISSEQKPVVQKDIIISDSSPVAEINELQEFIPYFIKEDYAGRDNKTILKGTKFEITVDIFGFYNENLVIYPFGSETSLPRFSETTIAMTFKDVDQTIKGTVYGILKQKDDGVYVIELTDFYSNGKKSRIEDYTLPLVLTGKINLNN